MTPDRVGGGGGAGVVQVPSAAAAGSVNQDPSLLLLLLLLLQPHPAAGTRPVVVPPTCSSPTIIPFRPSPPSPTSPTHRATPSSATLQAPWMPPRPGFHGSPVAMVPAKSGSNKRDGGGQSVCVCKWGVCTMATLRQIRKKIKQTRKYAQRKRRKIY